MGDPAWVTLALTLALAVLGGFVWVVRRIDAVEARLILRMDTVAEQQTQYRHEANNRLGDNLNQVEAKIEDAVKEADKAHRELMVQVRDMAVTMRDNFVSKSDLREVLSQIHDTLTEIRKEVGGVHTRVDDLYRSGFSKDRN